jgi:hypothetical protein
MDGTTIVTALMPFNQREKLSEVRSAQLSPQYADS